MSAEPRAVESAPGFCGRCEDGWIIDEATNSSRECQCRARVVEIRKVRRVLTELPRLYRESGAELDRRPVLDLAPGVQRVLRHYAGSIDRYLQQGKGLWFTGPHSTGKTSAAIAIAKVARRAGHTIGFHVVPDLLDRLRAATWGETGGGGAMIDELVALDLLILDDVGAEGTTDWVLERFYRILNGRYWEQRAVILTTNLDLDDLRQQVGARIVSRLYQMCEQPLRFEGLDHRQEQARSWEDLATQEETKAAG